LAELFNAEAPERMILTSGATQALNLAIFGLFLFGRTPPTPGGSRPRVVFSALEHNSVTRPLMELADRGMIDTVEVPFDEEGLVDPKAVARATDDRTVLVAVQKASNVVGSVQEIGAIRRALDGAGRRPLLLVDAAQAAGIAPIDVRAEGIDLLTFSGHKGPLGPTGTGGLYVSARAFPGAEGFELGPASVGGTGVDSESRRMPGRLPSRFEAGTPNVLGQVGLLAALDDPSRPTVAETLAHERRIADRFIDAWRDDARVRVFGPRDRSRRGVGTGVVSFGVRGMSPADVEGVLGSSFGIAVRSGLHCAPGAHRVLGTLEAGGTVRMSPGPASSERDADALTEALREIVT
jgi:selenocysteine lyase/cysteine desulfurase